MRRGGYTLAELLTVLVLVTALVLALMPRNHEARGAALPGAASMLGTALLRAQVAAVSEGRTVRVTVDSDSCRVLIEALVDEGTGSERYVLRSEIPLLPRRSAATQGLEVQAVNFQGRRYITFDATGAASAGGTVILKQGPHRREVVVSPLTGAVRVEMS